MTNNDDYIYTASEILDFVEWETEYLEISLQGQDNRISRFTTKPSLGHFIRVCGVGEFRCMIFNKYSEVDRHPHVLMMSISSETFQVVHDMRREALQ